MVEKPARRRRGGRGNDSDTDDDDSSAMLEPTADGRGTAMRTSCYQPLLQRVKDRHYFDRDELPHDHTSSPTDAAGERQDSAPARTFVIEVPLSELSKWDKSRGLDLAARATRNTVRYQELFCRVIDEVLGEMEISADGPAGRGAGGSAALGAQGA